MYTLITLVVGIISVLSATSAAPTQPGPRNPFDSRDPDSSPNVALFNLPAAITPPAGETLKLVYLGYGTQNYTCNATTGAYATSGTAVAKLLDVTKYYTGTTLPSVLPPIQDIPPVGSHFYVPNPLSPTSIVPSFADDTGFFIGTKNATVASVISTYSVAAVLLKNVQPGQVGGTLADWIVRTDVVGGVTPTVLNTCNAGDAIAIPYKAHYLFFKSG